MVNKAVLRPGETLESTSSGCLTTHIYICDVPDALLPFWSFKLFGGPAVIPGKKMPIAERENFDLPVQITLSRKRIVENVDARLQKAKKLGL
uniref:FAA_hydrolase domain-containing protein n=1 Tax=Steinernema glaseri TaxID=37863 RepID=A0A1I7Z7X9_9BILA